MEENNNQNNTVNDNEFKTHICFKDHCWKKCLAMVIASFIGGFLAFYFVADQIMYRKHMQMPFPPHYFEKRMFDDFERMHHKQKQDINKIFEKDMDIFKEAYKINKNFEKRMLSEMKMPAFMLDSVKIKTEFDENKFNVIVCLKVFDGDDSKVNYNLNGRKLTVFGDSQIKENNYEKNISFSQDFILPENADISKVSKTKDGNNLIISVPMKEQ